VRLPFKGAEVGTGPSRFGVRRNSRVIDVLMRTPKDGKTNSESGMVGVGVYVLGLERASRSPEASAVEERVAGG
jgi:hypothetical protein